MMSWYILMCRHNDAPPMYLYPGTSAHMSHVSQSWFITTGNLPPVTLSSILINVPEPQRLASTGPQLQTLRCILKSLILHWVHLYPSRHILWILIYLHVVKSLHCSFLNPDICLATLTLTGPQHDKHCVVSWILIYPHIVYIASYILIYLHIE